MSESVVHLRFPAKPDYLLLARLALSGLARELPLGDELLADLKLALTEACGNVVRHAYTDGGGDVSVVFTIDDSRILLTVEDRGDGIKAPDAPDATPATTGRSKAAWGCRSSARSSTSSRWSRDRTAGEPSFEW